MTAREHQLLHELEREQELLDELASMESRLLDAFESAIAHPTHPDNRPRA